MICSDYQGSDHVLFCCVVGKRVQESICIIISFGLLCYNGHHLVLNFNSDHSIAIMIAACEYNASRLQYKYNALICIFVIKWEIICTTK